jgi:hypothetical protein
LRDINRIYRITSLLQEAWTEFPDWRFGQLIENFKRYLNIEDLFYLEDDVLEEKFKEFIIKRNEG